MCIQYESYDCIEIMLNLVFLDKYFTFNFNILYKTCKIIHDKNPSKM